MTHRSPWASSIGCPAPRTGRAEPSRATCGPLPPVNERCRFGDGSARAPHSRSSTARSAAWSPRRSGHRSAPIRLPVPSRAGEHARLRSSPDAAGLPRRLPPSGPGGGARSRVGARRRSPSDRVRGRGHALWRLCGRSRRTSKTPPSIHVAAPGGRAVGDPGPWGCPRERRPVPGAAPGSTSLSRAGTVGLPPATWAIGRGRAGTVVARAGSRRPPRGPPHLSGGMAGAG